MAPMILFLLLLVLHFFLSESIFFFKTGIRLKDRLI